MAGISSGSHWKGIKRGPLESSDIAILGVPFDGAVSGPRGAAEGPDRIRQLSGRVSPFGEEGQDLRGLVICDRGNVIYKQDWDNYYREVEHRASGLMQNGCLPLFLGGDHSVTIPLAGAFARHYQPEPVGMVHLDAHSDLMDFYDGLHWSHACPQRRFLEHDNVFPENMVLVGIRDFEPEEIEFLKTEPAITVISAHQYYRAGHRAALEKIFQTMAGLKAVYLSVDIDILDPAYAPGTGTPQAGGLSTRELMELVREVVAGLPVKAVDLVEVAPPLDYSDLTSRAALKVIYEIFTAVALARH